MLVEIRSVRKNASKDISGVVDHVLRCYCLTSVKQ